MECANCYIPNRDIPDMDADFVLDVVSRIPRRRIIRYIGAEPTLHPELPRLIRTTKQFGHHSTMLTNGLLMHQRMVDNLWDAGLRSLGFAINGADDDDVYKAIDNGKYAFVKTRNLKTTIDRGMWVHTNTILAPDLSEHIPERVFNLMYPLIKDRRHPDWYTMRFKNIGAIGRFMDGPNFTVDHIVDILHGVPDLVLGQRNYDLDGLHNKGTFLLRGTYREVPVSVKVTDWQVDDEGVPDSGSKRRGRITPEGKIAPFFEHVKENEHGF